MKHSVDPVKSLLDRARPEGDQAWYDLLATAAELTAHGIEAAYRQHVAAKVQVGAVVVSGGGARNPALMSRLAERFASIPVRRSDEYGLPVDAKEAIAFAILASERIDRRHSNMPSVTGAARYTLLGKVTES